ncbi:nicotinate phosphoribosyltransferase [Desulfurobacterium pacificum]|uniref:Nicotinate phosphoribosyltransferase n=1 Tax=Desulfurobacterium pacificum TaxID=240166 RepID=A0ABY1NCU4_9BACT|nr:nicotinate phosphoribosyltransferase [Desulfurobacterium pacificum]SMP06650.1 nicotinate phosphoribosyltransferase [Desulfurobacterium pacificum]
MVSPLFTDLYQLTMMCAYLENGKKERAAFELFVRELPEKRNYLVFAGLEEVLKALEEFHFSKDDIDYLFSLKIFPDWFLDYLKEFSFSGDVYAMDEGTPFFQYEPVLRVEAPIAEAQLLETFVMNQIHISSLIASKAARVYSVAEGRVLADFSLRRTHGIDAGLKVARSCYLAGFDATSNVLAGKIYGVPVVGTVAHSFIMSFESEEEAFRAYAKVFPNNTVLLVDTYDTVEGVKKAIEVGEELLKRGFRLKGIRLDSGNVEELAKIARRLLDEAGMDYVKIIVSGGLDEYRIKEIISSGAPVDGFGVGTKVGTSADAPYIDFVYKLVEFDGQPVMKTSSGKKMYPGRKQVFRLEGYDVVSLWGEQFDGKPLLKQFMKDGRVVESLPSLNEVREYTIEQLHSLPESVLSIDRKVNYRVDISDSLNRLYKELRERLLGGSRS